MRKTRVELFFSDNLICSVLRVCLEVEGSEKSSKVFGRDKKSGTGKRVCPLLVSYCEYIFSR
jgi:hypothetical protein